MLFILPLFWLAIIVLVVAGMWKTFAKAGQPGWACLIPIYNVYIMCKIAQRPGWWVVLMFVPLANIVVAFIIAIDIAKHFGKGTGFGVGLALLPAIFYAILGFGDATYGPPPPPLAPSPQPIQA